VKARSVACFLVLVTALLGCPAARPPSPGFRFTPVDEGVEYARFFVAASGARAAFDGHAFRVDLSRADLRMLSAGGPTTRRDVDTIVRALPRVVASNASFFAEDGRAMGLVVDQGTLRGRRRIKKWGALVVEGDRARVVEGSAVDLGARPTLVAQGQPRLVVDGRAAGLKPQSARRTVVCTTGASDARGHASIVLIVTSDVDASALAAVLAASESDGGLACADAINFDGGPSTQLVARLGEVGVVVRGGDAVPNALAIIPGRSAAPLLDDAGPGAPVEEDGGAPLGAPAIDDGGARVTRP